MAISELLPGVEATVCVDDIPLVEYDNNDIKIETDESEEKKALASKTVSKYIEAFTDKHFSVDFSIAETHKSCYVNGRFSFKYRSRGRTFSFIPAFLHQLNFLQKS